MSRSLPGGPPYDLHTHTQFSCDSPSTMEAMCRQAVALGLRQIAFTEHVDYIPADSGYGFFQPAGFLGEVDRCRDLFGDRLTILSGVEIGEFHRFQPQARALLEANSFDLVIGSLHWVEDELVFDGSYFRRPADRAFGDYFAELERMCLTGGFDVLGHLDVVKRHGFEFYGCYDVNRYEGAIRPTLEALIQKGIALEINTSTLRRSVGQPSPGAALLGWYREMGGDRLTFGSDAHTPADLATGWERSSAMAQAAGFTAWTTYSNRIPSILPLESE